jgi:hypothetical protein
MVNADQQGAPRLGIKREYEDYCYPEAENNLAKAYHTGDHGGESS